MFLANGAMRRDCRALLWTRLITSKSYRRSFNASTQLQSSSHKEFHDLIRSDRASLLMPRSIFLKPPIG